MVIGVVGLAAIKMVVSIKVLPCRSKTSMVRLPAVLGYTSNEFKITGFITSKYKPLISFAVKAAPDSWQPVGRRTAAVI